MWTLGLALWMFDRDRQPIDDWLKAKFAKAPELAEANIAALNAGHAYGETAEIGGPLKPAPSSLRRRPSPASTAPSPAPRRSRSAWSPARSWPACRCSSAAIRSPRPSRSSTICRGSRNMASPPSRPRTRSPRSPPRSARASPAARRHLLVGPGHRAQDRGDGPRDHDRAAAGHRQLAARRPLDRPADQDRAVGPLPGGLRPQRRCADAGDRRALARRRLRLRDRGVPDRGPVHDPGDAADRRLYRQCRRAVEGAGHGQLRSPSRSPSTTSRSAKGEAVNPYARDDKLARVWIKPGTPGPDAPHRRHREECRHRPHRLCARPTTRR